MGACVCAYGVGGAIGQGCFSMGGAAGHGYTCAGVWVAAVYAASATPCNLPACMHARTTSGSPPSAEPYSLIAMLYSPREKAASASFRWEATSSTGSAFFGSSRFGSSPSPRTTPACERWASVRMRSSQMPSHGLAWVVRGVAIGVGAHPARRRQPAARRRTAPDRPAPWCPLHTGQPQVSLAL